MIVFRNITTKNTKSTKGRGRNDNKVRFHQENTFSNFSSILPLLFVLFVFFVVKIYDQ
jgi:hypothetical protein